LGIIAKVLITTQVNKHILVINIQKSDVPISYNGKYYIRTGSTTQELSGRELTKFIISKSHNNWDEYIIPQSSLDDLSMDTINKFRELSSQRLPFIKTEKDILIILNKLNLIEKKQVKRAAVLLFGKDPKRYVTGAFIRIGKFNNNNELVSTDTIEGNLFEQVDQCMELLKTKYLISKTHYEGLYRKEELEFPEPVLREAIINAVIHRDYLGAHTQIKIYPSEINIWNEGCLPGSLSVEDLKQQHPSRPRNELLADIFFKAGLIETWGHGTLKMISICKKVGLPEPEYTEKHGGFSVVLRLDISNDQLISEYGLTNRQIKGIVFLRDNNKITNKLYRDINSVSKATATNDLGKLVDKGLLLKIGNRGAGAYYTLNL